MFQGISTIPCSVLSTSSCSAASEYELMSKTYMASHRNFSGCHSFMSKPVHPLLFPDQTFETEAKVPVSSPNPNKKLTHVGDSTLHSDSKSIRMLSELPSSSGFSDLGTTPQREGLRWSSASSIDFTDVSKHLYQESMGFSWNLSEGSKCGLCERLLSQRSPWSSLRIVRSGDMPVAGVLSCWHVYHADCLDQTTPKAQKHDPPCPLCAKSVNIQDKRVVGRLKMGISNVRSFGDNGPSRAWSCGQVGDCVEGSLHTEAHASMLLVSRNRLKKQLSMKKVLGKELPDKLKKTDQFSWQMLPGWGSVDQSVGCSRARSGVLKRW